MFYGTNKKTVIVFIESVMSKKLTLTEAGSCSSEQDLDHKTIEEKRKIYQEAFYTDLENFKKSGTIPGKSNT